MKKANPKSVKPVRASKPRTAEPPPITDTEFIGLLDEIVEMDRAQKLQDEYALRELDKLAVQLREQHKTGRDHPGAKKMSEVDWSKVNRRYR